MSAVVGSTLKKPTRLGVSGAVSGRGVSVVRAEGGQEGGHYYHLLA